MKKLAAGLRSRISQRPLTVLVISFVAGALLVGGIVAGVESSKVSDLTGQKDRARSELERVRNTLQATQNQRDTAKQTADRITDQRDSILQAARDKASTMVDDAEGKLDKLNSQIDDASGELSSTQERLDSTQASLDQAQETKAMSSFGDGTYQSGVDYIPGTYSAPGGSGCYWEKLNGPSGGGIDNIIDNGGFDKNQIVSVDSPYFHSSGCGTWTKTG